MTALSANAGRALPDSRSLKEAMPSDRTHKEPIQATSDAEYYLTPPAGFTQLDVVTSAVQSPYVYIDVAVTLESKEPSIELESVTFSLTACTLTSALV
jgi:hypothetical protein